MPHFAPYNRAWDGSSGSIAAARSRTSWRDAPTARYSPTSCSPKARATTTPRVQGIRDLLGLAASAPLPTELIDAVRMGTTVATNALLERKGDRTVFVTTRGFADALRIAYQHRPKLFVRRIELPSMLYEEVVEIDERIGAHGDVVRPLDAAAAEAALRAAYRPRHPRLRHRADARLPLSRARRGELAALADAHRLQQISRLAPREPADQARRARRHHRRRRLSIAGAAALRGSRGRGAARARACSSCSPRAA